MTNVPEVTADQITWTLAPVSADPLDDDAIVDALLDAEAYRLLAQQALHALHALTGDHDRLQQRHRQLHDEYRRLREQVLRDAGAAP